MFAVLSCPVLRCPVPSSPETESNILLYSTRATFIGSGCAEASFAACRCVCACCPTRSPRAPRRSQRRPPRPSSSSRRGTTCRCSPPTSTCMHSCCYYIIIVVVVVQSSLHQTGQRSTCAIVYTREIFNSCKKNNNIFV